MKRPKKRRPTRNTQQRAFKKALMQAAGLEALAPRRYRLVGTEIESPSKEQRWFAIDDWRLAGAQLAFRAQDIQDEATIEGRGGTTLTAFSVAVGTPVIISRGSTVERVTRPLLRELLQVQQRTLMARLPRALMQQEGAGGEIRKDGEEEPQRDIELTWGAAKDREQFGEEPAPNPEFTIRQMKESIGDPDAEDDSSDFPQHTDILKDPTDPGGGQEQGPTWPPGTLISPLELTDKTHDELSPRTNLMDDPLTLSIYDFTVKSQDAPEPPPGAEGPVAPEATSIVADFVPPPKRPIDDLMPLPPGPDGWDRLFDFFKKYFTLPSNPDPEANPNERRVGLDINIPW